MGIGHPSPRVQFDQRSAAHRRLVLRLRRRRLHCSPYAPALAPTVVAAVTAAALAPTALAPTAQTAAVAAAVAARTATLGRDSCAHADGKRQCRGLRGYI